MFRTAIIAVAAIVTAVAFGSAAAQSSSPISKLDNAAPAGQWAVVRAGERTISHCMMGLRSDAAAPQPGQPQFMISADSEFVILRIRAAEWSFAGSRNIAVALVTSGGNQRQPAAAVHGSDLIDIAFGVAPEHMNELAASDHLEIRTEGTAVRLPLQGLADVLPAYRNCLASIGQRQTGLHASAALDAR